MVECPALNRGVQSSSLWRRTNRERVCGDVGRVIRSIASSWAGVSGIVLGRVVTAGGEVKNILERKYP